MVWERGGFWIPGRKAGRRGRTGTAAPYLSGDLKPFTQILRRCHQYGFRQQSLADCNLVAPVSLYLFPDLPPETIEVPPLARAIVPSGTARKAAGELRVSTHPLSPQNRNFPTKWRFIYLKKISYPHFFY